jgi:hypothetical protein
MEYYLVAIVFLLIWSLAISVGSIATRSPMLGPILASMLMLSNLTYFNARYALDLTKEINSSNSRTLALADVIRRYTAKESGLVIFSHNWSSEIGYYSERKSFTIDKEGYSLGRNAEKNFEDRVWDDPAAFLGGLKLGAIVICIKGDVSRYAQVIAKYSLGKPKTFAIKDCYVWFPGVTEIELSDGTRQSAIDIAGSAQ